MSFSNQKFSSRVLLRICLIFLQFQPGAASKSVAYKKGYIDYEIFLLLLYV